MKRPIKWYIWRFEGKKNKALAANKFYTQIFGVNALVRKNRLEEAQALKRKWRGGQRVKFSEGPAEHWEERKEKQKRRRTL